MSLKNRSFLKLLDYTPAEIRYLLDLAKNFKDLKQEKVAKFVEGKNIVKVILVKNKLVNLIVK